MTPVTGPDWDAIRRSYDGGRGGTLREVAERWGVPFVTLARRSVAEGWRRTSPQSDVIRQRVRELVRAEPLLGPAAIRQRLEAEFGDDPGLLSCNAIRHIKAGPRRPGPMMTEPTPDSLHGLTRRCHACDQQTTADPCAWCATLSHQVTA